MKFGKWLKRQIEETLPEWRDKFLAYKDLKKKVKFIASVLEPATSLDNEIQRDSSEEVSEYREVSEHRTRKRPRFEYDVEGAGDSASTSVKSAESKSNSRDDSNQRIKAKNADSIKAKMTAEESDFVQMLNAEIEKLNAFFVEQEEEYIIRQKELQDRIEEVKNRSGPNGISPSETDYNEEMIKVKKGIVNLHGEMVLLENYSALNYTGLVKILKKYDKRTGALLRLPFIQRVLQQPFFTTELLSKLVRECENTLQSLFPDYPLTIDEAAIPDQQSICGEDANSRSETTDLPQVSKEEVGNPVEKVAGVGNPVEKVAGQDIVENIYRNTMAALRTMTEMRRGSSTYSAFSLPPLHNNGETVDDKKSIPLCSLIPLCPQN